MSIAAECGLRFWRSQIEVEVSCQVFDPHWWVFWKQGLTASQLLLQVGNVQLKRERGIKAVYSETTRPLCKDETAVQHVMVCFEYATTQRLYEDVNDF